MQAADREGTLWAAQDARAEAVEKHTSAAASLREALNETREQFDEACARNTEELRQLKAAHVEQVARLREERSLAYEDGRESATQVCCCCPDGIGDS